MLTPSLRPKLCAYCETRFTPVRPLQAVCSPRCARRKVAAARAEEKAKAKADRAITRARKEAMKNLPELHREAQKEFNAWCRARDAKQPCISCGKPPGDMTQLHAGRDAGHYRSVGSAPHLRYHEDNVHAQCVRCNQWDAGKAVDYRIGLVARIGVERVEALESANAVHKWSKDEVRGIRDSYRAKLKALLAQKEK